MKVGKKVLSTLLAIIMIVSSVSVCFGVLGADVSVSKAIEELMVQVELHHGVLADYIIDATPKEGYTPSADAKKKVPQQVGSTSTWKVELDSSTSSWHWVTSAYVAAVNAVLKDSNLNVAKATLGEINESIKGLVATAAALQGDNAMKAEQYNEILNPYAFGDYEGSVTLNIGEGFDILQWADPENPNAYTFIPEDSDSLTLYVATATFTYDSVNGKLTGAEFENTIQDSVSLAENMKFVKEAIANFITKADEWFHTDYSSLSVEVLNKKVTQISDDIVAFEGFVKVGNYEEVWDAYVAPSAGYTWAEVKQWYKTNIVDYVAAAYAKQYQDAIEGYFTVSDSQTVGDDLLDTYNLIKLELEKLDAQTAYNGDETVNIADLIVEAFAEKDGVSGLKYYNKVLSRHTELGHKLAIAFANEVYPAFTEQFVAIVDTDLKDPTYVGSAEAKAMGHKWEETCDGNCGQLCPGGTYKATDENGNEVV